MAVHTSAGSKIYIGTTATALLTDTFTEIGEVVNIGDFGRVYSEIKFDTLGVRGTRKFKGTYDDGNLAMQLGRDPSDAGQAMVIAARDADFDYNFKIVDNDVVASRVFAGSTITIAAPGVVTTLTPHGLSIGDQVMFSTTGALPTGLLAATTYFVQSVPSSTTVQLALTAGGAAITTSGTQSGAHTLTVVPVGTSTYFKAKVMSYTKKISGPNQVVGADCMVSIKSGSIVEISASL
jgi:hypothetical protein